MRRLLLGALLIVGVLAAPALAEARQLKPEERSFAVEIAEEYWNDRGYYAEDEGCWRVRTKVGFTEDRNNLGYWDEYDHCRLVLNGNFDWSYRGKRDPWWQLCTTTIHEYGHLVGWRSRSGNEHNWTNPNSIMAAFVAMNKQSWWWPYFPACAE